jgi:uncharacterized protein YggT (Ycf19 family)
MFVIDAIGVIVTICFIGIRYPHYVLAACLINQLGQVVATLFLQLHIEGMLASGVFTNMQVSGATATVILLLALSGAFLNYAAGVAVTGFEFEPTAHLIKPFARLRSPFAVINLRFAVVMFCVQLIHYVSQ